MFILKVENELKVVGRREIGVKEWNREVVVERYMKYLLESFENDGIMEDFLKEMLERDGVRCFRMDEGDLFFIG